MTFEPEGTGMRLLVVVGETEPPERLVERLRPLGLALSAHVPDNSEPTERGT